ncbi:MAG: M1 family metallopeptidase [Ferruginibacter sp.]
MKKLLFLSVFSYLFFSSACGQTGYWQQQVNYKIDVSLNDTDNALNGYIIMQYYNNSTDTLQFIWINLWPNAYKNDRTAYSDQLLENGNTNFYFSDDDKRGYINQLDFKVDGITAEMQDHPEQQDIIKLLLPKPLAPKSNIRIETPFYVKLPYNFTGNGYTNQSYQITQWYPKPAVYDQKGWHEMPYLAQDGSYNEFGNYEVKITLPENYVIAATGEEDTSLKKQNIKEQTKTLIFKQENVTDFVWFADKDFLVKHDTIQSSGKIINAFIYYTKDNESKWATSMQFIKDAINTKSKLIGEYPYPLVSIVENSCKYNQLAAYPCISLMKASGNEQTMDFLINHLTGYDWFGSALANNQRAYPWMNKGMNLYYDDKFFKDKNETPLQLMDIKNEWLKKRLPDDPVNNIFETITSEKKDQPIATSADSFSLMNYYYIAFHKTKEWLNLIEADTLSDCMQQYYQHWKFKHPYPEDFKKELENVSGKKEDSFFSLLNKKGNLSTSTINKTLKIVSLFSLKETDKYNYISVAPAVGYNLYDQLMIGAFIHNYTLPPTKFQFFISPLYATGSKQLNGIAGMNYTLYPNTNNDKIEFSLSGETFSEDSFTDSAGFTKYFRFSKIVPAIKYVFASNPRSSITKFIQWKTFFIREEELLFTRDTVNQTENITYPSASHYINQLRFVIENNRVLYPYNGELKIEQGQGFVKAGFTGNYYFNYQHEGGLNVRLFTGKFFYIGEKTYSKLAETYQYQLNLAGPRGGDDYTYSDYFLGRNKFDGIGSQQLMMRDGFFKLSTDLQNPQITDDWLSAINFTTDVPNSINPLQIFPVKIPLKAFLDVGSFAAGWQANSATPKFLYDAGLQLSLIKNTVNIYIPIFYSSLYRDYYTSIFPQNKFWKSVSFSIDIQNIKLNKFIPKIAF